MYTVQDFESFLNWLPGKIEYSTSWRFVFSNYSNKDSLVEIRPLYRLEINTPREPALLIPEAFTIKLDGSKLVLDTILPFVPKSCVPESIRRISCDIKFEQNGIDFGEVEYPECIDDVSNAKLFLPELLEGLKYYILLFKKHEYNEALTFVKSIDDNLIPYEALKFIPQIDESRRQSTEPIPYKLVHPINYLKGSEKWRETHGTKDI